MSTRPQVRKGVRIEKAAVLFLFNEWTARFEQKRVSFNLNFLILYLSFCRVLKRLLGADGFPRRISRPASFP